MWLTLHSEPEYAYSKIVSADWNISEYCASKFCWLDYFIIFTCWSGNHQFFSQIGLNGCFLKKKYAFVLIFSLTQVIWLYVKC